MKFADDLIVLNNGFSRSQVEKTRGSLYQHDYSTHAAPFCPTSVNSSRVLLYDHILSVICRIFRII